MSTPAPGWYPDPAAPPGVPAGLRWWDGSTWTWQVQQAAPASGATTPDGAVLAEWWQRLLAYVVDGAILAIPVLGLILLWFVALIGSVFKDDVGAAAVLGNGLKVVFVVVIVLVALYEPLFLRFKGATPGKMVMGLQVRLRDRPGRLPWSAIGLRFLVKSGAQGLGLIPHVGATIAWIAVLGDGLWPLWDKNRQALHDKLAGTNVVRVR